MLRFVLWAVLSVLAPAWVARADARLPNLRFSACDALAQDEVRRIARTELGSHGQFAADVEVSCVAEVVRLRASYGAYSAGKTVSVADVEPDSRPRLVALAAAELVHELERLTRLPPSPPAALPLPPPPRGPRFAFSLGPRLDVPLRSPMLALGGTLLGRAYVLPWLSLGLSGELSRGERTISGGSLRHRSASLGLTLRAERSHAYVRTFAELALLGSADELRGVPDSARRVGDRFRATSLGLRASLGLEVPFARRGFAGLSLGLTRKSRTLLARNEGQPASQVGPWFVGGALAVGGRF